MLNLCSPELIHLQKNTGPIYNDKKVNFLTTGEDCLSKVSADPEPWAGGSSKIYSGQRPLPGSWRV